MTPEEVQQLINGSLESFRETILSDVTKANQGVAANISKQLKKLEEKMGGTTSADGEQPAEGEGDRKYSKADKALLQRLEQLEQERQQEKAQALAASRRAAIADLVSSRQLNQPELVKKLLLADYGEKLSQENGAWYIEDGEKVTALNDAFESFLNTDQGKYFIPAAATQGAGSKESKKPAVSGTDKPQTAGAVIAQSLLSN